MDIVAGCIIKRDNKILMVQEAKEKYYGQWNFPAGHIEDGENMLEGAIREVKEETGCDVKLTGVLPMKIEEIKNMDEKNLRAIETNKATFQDFINNKIYPLDIFDIRKYIL